MRTVTLKDKTFESYIMKSGIISRITKLANQISNDLSGKNPLFVVVLNGAMLFGSELFLQITIPAEITTMRLKSYSGTKSAGTIETIMPIQEDVSGRTVVIVEDIVDSGATIQYVIERVKNLGAAEVHVATLCFKEEACKIPGFKPDYIGYIIPNRFIVGHGFDYDGAGRNLPDIYALRQ